MRNRTERIIHHWPRNKAKIQSIQHQTDKLNSNKKFSHRHQKRNLYPKSRGKISHMSNIKQRIENKCAKEEAFHSRNKCKSIRNKLRNQISNKKRRVKWMTVENISGNFFFLAAAHKFMVNVNISQLSFPPLHNHIINKLLLN